MSELMESKMCRATTLVGSIVLAIIFGVNIYYMNQIRENANTDSDKSKANFLLIINIVGLILALIVAIWAFVRILQYRRSVNIVFARPYVH